jgi:hypothetical protein
LKKIKEIDKGILVGSILTFSFLILWLVTLPQARVELQAGFGATMLNESELKLRYDADIDNFNRALLTGNRSICSKIYNTSMKKECNKVAPDQVAIVEQFEDAPKYSEADTDNFNRAILTNDKKYCNDILDEKVKADCFLSVQGEIPQGNTQSTIEFVDDDSTQSNEEIIIQEPVAVESAVKSDPKDVDNFNKAILTGDKSHCNQILDVQLKSDCLNLQV